MDTQPRQWRVPRTIAAFALCVAATVDIYATSQLAAAMGPANDLFPRWYGARMWLLQGLDPYSDGVSSGIRSSMGGAPGEPVGGFVFGFVYPGYVALFLAPLALLPFHAAATIWLLLAQVGVCAGAWWCWKAAEAESGLGRRGPLPFVAAALVLPASLMNLAFGQFAALVLACLALAWRLSGGKHQAIMGASLALALVKPSVALLPVAALLGWCLLNWRRRVVSWWLATTGCTVAASLVALPNWPVAFWASTAQYARVAGATSAAALAGRAIVEGTGLDVAVESGVTALLAAGVGLLVLWGWRASLRRAGDTLAAGILLSAWLVPPLYEWNSLLLIQPLALLTCRGGAAESRCRLTLMVVLSVATLPAIAWRPSESRLIWPSLVLAATVVNWRYRRGTQNVTVRPATSPSVPATT